MAKKAAPAAPAIGTSENPDTFAPLVQFLDWEVAHEQADLPLHGHTTRTYRQLTPRGERILTTITNAFGNVVFTDLDTPPHNSIPEVMGALQGVYETLNRPLVGQDAPTPDRG